MVSVSLYFILKMTCVFVVSQLQSGLFSPAKIMVDLLSFHLRAKLLQEKKRLKKKKKKENIKGVLYFPCHQRLTDKSLC